MRNEQRDEVTEITCSNPDQFLNIYILTIVEIDCKKAQANPEKIGTLVIDRL